MQIIIKAKNVVLNAPDLTIQLTYLGPAVVEIIEGARSITQLGGLVNEDVYQLLKRKAIEADSRRRKLGLKSQFPVISVSKIHQESSTPRLVEAIVLMRVKDRTRAMTVRMENRIGRWLATAITIL